MTESTGPVTDTADAGTEVEETYEVNEQERFVMHRIELSWFPNLVGTQQKRFFAFADDRLTLETPPLTLLGDAQVHRLVWQRLM